MLIVSAPFGSTPEMKEKPDGPEMNTAMLSRGCPLPFSRVTNTDVVVCSPTVEFAPANRLFVKRFVTSAACATASGRNQGDSQNQTRDLLLHRELSFF